MLEAARAYAALDERDTATLDDLRVVAPMALRQRESTFITDYMAKETDYDHQIGDIISG